MVARQIKDRKESKRLVAASYKESFSGPIPPPEILAGYEKILPGSASRILSMAEKQSKHRRLLEKQVVGSNIENEKEGMNYSFLLTIVLMVFGFVLVQQDKGIIGFAAIFGPSLFHAGNYVYSRIEEKKEMERKRRENDKPRQLKLSR